MRTWPRTDGRTALRTIDRTSVGLPSDPFFSSTTLLLPGNGTNGAQNNTFLDSSTNAFSITRNGNTTQGTFSPFPPASGTAYSAAANGGSGSFDGVSDYLAVTNNNTFDTNSTFTLECWFYQPTAGNGTFFSRGGGAASWSTVNGAQVGLLIESGTFYWQWNNSGSATSITTTSPAAGAWHHVAVGYNGTTTRVWLNGTSIGTSAVGYTLPTTRDRVWCGLNQDGSSGPMNGYISNLRFVKGTDVYGVGNTSITVPTAPLTAITNTSLLLNFTNAGVLDATAKNDLETVGNAQISTAQSKWGGASIAFDGTGDYLPLQNVLTANFGSGPFTAELWIYFNNASGTQYALSNYQNNSIGWGLGISSGNFAFWATGDTPDISTSTPAATGTWYHLAVSGQSGAIRLFLNGTQIGSTFTGTPSLDSTLPLRVGDGQGAASPLPLNGYIDDLRITKGVARYTASFTAPTAAFPLY
jgi:hypothetical protein